VKNHKILKALGIIILIWWVATHGIPTTSPIVPAPTPPAAVNGTP
jgi:hypothetical protein